MGARQKLNAIYITVCSLAAAALGLAFQSWGAFAAGAGIWAGPQSARWRDPARQVDTKPSSAESLSFRFRKLGAPALGFSLCFVRPSC